MQLQRYLNMFIMILVLFRPFYNYSNLDPSLQNKQNSSQQSKSSREFSFVKFSFCIIYGVVLIYVYFWSNLLFDFNVTATHLHLRKYQFLVVKYPRQFKRIQLEIKMQLL